MRWDDWSYKINEYIQQWLCRFRLGGETDETSNGHISSSSDASNAQRNIDCYFHFLFDILISIFHDSWAEDLLRAGFKFLHSRLEKICFQTANGLQNMCTRA